MFGVKFEPGRGRGFLQPPGFQLLKFSGKGAVGEPRPQQRAELIQQMTGVPLGPLRVFAISRIERLMVSITGQGKYPDKFAAQGAHTPKVEL